jgi:hypothetical protein
MPHRKARTVNARLVDIGDIVAFNTLPDATRFEVQSRNGFSLMVRQVRDPGMTRDYAGQQADVSTVAQHWRKVD